MARRNGEELAVSTRKRISVAAAIVLGVGAGGGTPAWADEPQPGPVRISTSAGGLQGNGSSSRPVISGDGRFAAFNSSATTLVTGDFGRTTAVFVKEIATGVVERVATGLLPTLSRDGRYVAFLSGAADVVPGDTNGKVDVFVHDRQADTTTRVNVASDGTAANGDSADAYLAADGRYVVFTSAATNLAPGATGTNRKVFVHDLATGVTTEVSVTPDGRSGGKDSSYATISADGRFVGFASQAKELVPGATTRNISSAYVRDLADGTTRRLPSGFVKGFVSISDDGRYVGYMDSRGDIVPGDTNGFNDVFRYDLASGEVIRVNVADDGTPADKDSGYVPQGVPMSADGRYVFFESAATNLVPGDTNARRDVFLRDTEAGTTTRVSVDGTHPSASAANYVGSVSTDGTTVVFMSDLALVPEDTNVASDVYLWRRG
jgi:Tol biopolymer transport system component